MRVLVLGGTGSIGAGVVSALVARQHEVVGLARSNRAAERLAAAGASVLSGDIRQPLGWIDTACDVDAVVQAASAFAADDELVEGRILELLIERLGLRARPQCLLYTGGCWLYGATGDAVATEESAFDPLPAFGWSVAHVNRVRAARHIRGIVIHPAMVYERDEGVFARFKDDLDAQRRVRIVGAEAVRWPLVHRQDIGTLYALALESAEPGAVYNGATVESLPVGTIARAMARRAGVTAPPTIQTMDEAAAELGEWARGYGLDQQMSGAKARRDLGWVPVHPDPLADIS